MDQVNKKYSKSKVLNEFDEDSTVECQNSTTNLNKSGSNNSINQIMNNSSNMNSKRKWKCLQCTYENWPSAQKCAICLTSKSTTSLRPNSASTNNNTTFKKTNINNLLNNESNNRKPKPHKKMINVIYDEQPTPFSRSNEDEVNLLDQSVEIHKWSCSVCTYLNWPKSLKCVQCYSSKNLSTTSTTLPTCPNILNVESVYRVENQENVNSTNSNKNNSPRSSPCTVQNTKTGVEVVTLNDGKSSTSSSSSNLSINNTLTVEGKWPCSACTYQNWPKSQRCVMCHVPRTNANSKNISNSNTNSTDSTNNGSQNNKQNVILKNNLIKLISKQEKVKSYHKNIDILFLAACQGVVDGDMSHLNRYINSGGDLTRYLTSDEVKLLLAHNTNNNTNNNLNSNLFTGGQTLIHLCYQFKRKDFLIQLINKSTTLNKNQVSINAGLAASSSANSLTKQTISLISKTKFSPCQSSPSLATNIIDRYFSASLRQRKSIIQYGATGSTNYSPTSSHISLNASPSPSPPPGAASSYHHLPFYHYHHQQQLALCYYVNESHTFSLPNEIEDFSIRIQSILFDELLDREVQQELENESRAINWNVELCKRFNSQLYPLWNRHSGDCLLDSVLQACYGVFDTDNTLRRVMAESLEQYSTFFKPRWKQHEILMAQSLGYKLDDDQLEQDWTNIIALANQPGASLEQAHIFALCHILRRPIIVYSVKYVKSFRGENIGFTHFEGVYLPLIWEPNFCFKNPIALGYTRGHFTALVPLERTEVFTCYSNDNIAPHILTSNNHNNNNNNNMMGSNSSTHMNANINSNRISNLNNFNTNDSNDSPSANKSDTTNDSDIFSSNASGFNMNNNHLSNTDYIDKYQEQIFYLPLTNNESLLLPIHFLNSSEVKINNFDLFLNSLHIRKNYSFFVLVGKGAFDSKAIPERRMLDYAR
jgi:hypothetical protein